MTDCRPENLRPAAAAAEWRAHGLMVLAAAIGMSFYSITSHALGLLMAPLQSEFSWSRSEIALGLTVSSVLAVPLSPLVGALIDRWGCRRLAIPGVVASMVAIAVFSLANGSIAQWLMLWVGYALASLLIKTTVWSAAVSGTFTHSRGLALACALSGTAIAQILVPPIAQHLIAAYGWRLALLMLAGGWGLLTLVLLILFFFDAGDRRRLDAASPASTPSLSGLAVADAVRSPVMIRIAVATLIACLLHMGVIVHQVPILVDRGIPLATAAYLASLTGIAAITGKLVSGFFMDRYDAGWVGGVSLALPCVGFLIMLNPPEARALMVVAMMTIGYAAGTSLQICAYLTTAHGGLRNFGKIFGVMSSLIAVGGGVGPIFAALLYDTYGSYRPLLIAGIPLSLVCAALITGLGPYPRWDEDPKVGA